MDARHEVCCMYTLDARSLYPCFDNKMAIGNMDCRASSMCLTKHKLVYVHDLIMRYLSLMT